jgi:competence protein ComEA
LRLDRAGPRGRECGCPARFKLAFCAVECKLFASRVVGGAFGAGERGEQVRPLNGWEIGGGRVIMVGWRGDAMAGERKTKRMRDGAGWRPVLRASDQAAVAGLACLALVGMAVYWVAQGGLRGELIEIDRAAPRVARFQVDINAADWPELAQMPGIGETLARRIVESRTKVGRFGDQEDLLRVNGIGPRTLDRMKPYLLPMPGQAEVAGSEPKGEQAL